MYNQYISTTTKTSAYIIAEEECQECDAEQGQENQPISSSCQLCIDFTPKVEVRTYNWFDLIIYLMLPLIVFVVVRIFYKKR